ncbi:hypothetical protein JCM13304A_21140 [Desulfothermus okinawensis JCM 13304]
MINKKTGKNKNDPFESIRHKMVEDQIVRRGVTNPLVISAMKRVPRHLFVSEGLTHKAYEDRPLPIGYDQTISQPYIVAYMTQALRLVGGEKVLEVGTGCGYQAAVLAEIAKEVYTIERIPELAEKARKTLGDLNYNNVHVIVGDGTLGLKQFAPYDAIIVTAGGPKVPKPLISQLKVGGRLVMPVGEYRYGQTLVRITKGINDKINEEKLIDVLFVPLIGDEGWS